MMRSQDNHLEGEWMQWCNYLLKPVVNQYSYDKDSVYQQRGQTALARLLGTLELELSKQKYLCGDFFTEADTAVVPVLRQIVDLPHDAIGITNYPCVCQWMKNVEAVNG